MTALFPALASGVIPATPLVVGYFEVIATIANAALVLCMAALWFERERTKPIQHPVHFGDEERLAA